MLGAVRETPPEVGVILMTAFASVETAREAFKLGADDFIQKPFDVEELKLIVKKTLEKQALIDENRAFADAFAGRRKNNPNRTKENKALSRIPVSLRPKYSSCFPNGVRYRIVPGQSSRGHHIRISPRANLAQAL
jgi:DNA-binding response OmpR family regulator